MNLGDPRKAVISAGENHSINEVLCACYIYFEAAIVMCALSRPIIYGHGNAQAILLTDESYASIFDGHNAYSRRSCVDAVVDALMVRRLEN